MSQRLTAPSLLAADFGHLERDVTMLNQSMCDWYHLDIMDGRFVPNISFGYPVIEAIARAAQKPLDVHLMTLCPEDQIERLKAVGAHVVTVHAEVSPHLHRTLSAIRSAGMLAGVALNPSTPISSVEDVLDEADVVMLMSVNPGFGGQKFIAHTYDKLQRLRRIIDEAHTATLIEIDGGVNRDNAGRLYALGADVLVCGSAVFRAADPVAEVEAIKQAEDATA